MTGVVLDTSALLALIRAEPGADKVAVRRRDAIMSVVNFAETVGVLIRTGATHDDATRKVAALVPRVIDATLSHASEAAALVPQTSAAGLSLGDRFCLALARAEGFPVLTADRAWSGLKLDGIEIELIR